MTPPPLASKVCAASSSSTTRPDSPAETASAAARSAFGSEAKGAASHGSAASAGRVKRANASARALRRKAGFMTAPESYSDATGHSNTFRNQLYSRRPNNHRRGVVHMKKLVLCGALVVAVAGSAFGQSPQKPGKWNVKMQMEIPGMPFEMPPI